MNELGHRSNCPINFTLEILGDKWSLLIIRDMILCDKTAYNEFLESEEKIATNILSQRLKMLEEAGLIKKHFDPSRKTKTKHLYLLTQKGIDLIPVLIEMMLWTEEHWSLASGPSVLIIEKARRNKAKTIRELRAAAEARVAALSND